jgi:hypothetical protein
VINANIAHIVGAAAGCDLLIFGELQIMQNQDQKIAACGSSYRGAICPGYLVRVL